MKTTTTNKFAVALLLGLAFLAGCNKKPAQDKAHYDTAPASTPAESAPAKSEVQANSVAYYRAHLDEAQKTWHECLAKGASKLDEREQVICEHAHSAWFTQAYKAKK